MSINQTVALTCILNLFKSYYLNLIYPSELITFQGGVNSDSSGATGCNETGTGGLGSFKTVIYPIVQKIVVHIFSKHYFQLIELIIDD